MPTKTQLKNRRKLIKTLRSGNYPQSAYGLKTPQGYCCQGVACDIFQSEVNGEWKDRVGENGSAFSMLGKPFSNRYTAYWPDEVRELVGLWVSDSRNLAYMNDGSMASYFDTPYSNYTLEEPCTFDEIADCLEYLTLAGL